MSLSSNKLFTVRDFCEKNPSWPSESALRAIILDAAWGQNKFQTAFKRIGRRVLVDEEEFWNCVERIQSEPKNA